MTGKLFCTKLHILNGKNIKQYLVVALENGIIILQGDK